MKTTVHQLLSVKGAQVYSTTPESTVFSAIDTMAQHRIGALVVMQGDKLAGIFSERDLAREVDLKDRNAKTTPVRDVMSTTVITVTPHHTVEECMQLMSGKRIRHLPVLENDKVVGLLSIGDLVQETIRYQQYLIDELEKYIHS